MNRRSVKHTLTMTCLMLVLLASLLLGATSIFSIRNTTNMALTEYESAMDSGYNTEIKSEVQTVIAVLQAEYDKSQAGELTEEEAKAEAKEIVRAMRYRDDGSGYFWIDDTDYNLVMHPILAEQEGNNRYDLEDQNGVMIIQEIMKVCNSADGGGFNEFYFTKADGVTVAPKVAYSELFAPWGWAVSTGNYVDDMQAEMTGVEGRINQKFEVLCIVIVIMMAVMLVMAFVWARIYAAKLCKPLVEIQGLASRLSDGDLTTTVNVREKNELGDTAEALNAAQKQIVSLIGSISTASTDLRNALQSFTGNFSSMQESIGNVAVAVNEIAENATQLAGVAADTKKDSDVVDVKMRETVEVSEKGRQDMEKVSKALEGIELSIHNLQEAVDKVGTASGEIVDITNLIGSIAEETNLLSLNASIEAARAGEAGRGFAVVASEISQMAQQTKDSTVQISQLIENVSNAIQMVVEVSGSMISMIESQNETTEKTAESFTVIEKNSDNVYGQSNELAAYVTKLADANKKIIDSISTISAISEEVAAHASDTLSATESNNVIVEELAALSGQLETLAQELKEQ